MDKSICGVAVGVEMTVQCAPRLLLSHDLEFSVIDDTNFLKSNFNDEPYNETPMLRIHHLQEPPGVCKWPCLHILQWCHNLRLILQTGGPRRGFLTVSDSWYSISYIFWATMKFRLCFTIFQWPFADYSQATGRYHQVRCRFDSSGIASGFRRYVARVIFLQTPQWLRHMHR